MLYYREAFKIQMESVNEQLVKNTTHNNGQKHMLDGESIPEINLIHDDQSWSE